MHAASARAKRAQHRIGRMERRAPIGSARPQRSRAAMDGQGLGLVLLMGVRLLAAQISNMIFSPGRGFPFAEFRAGRKAPIL